MLLTHKTRDKKSVYIAAMTDSHLMNLTRMMLKQLEEHTFALDSLLGPPQTSPSRYMEPTRTEDMATKREECRESISILTVLISVYILELCIRKDVNGWQFVEDYQRIIGRTSSINPIAVTTRHAINYNLNNMLLTMSNKSRPIIAHESLDWLSDEDDDDDDD